MILTPNCYTKYLLAALAQRAGVRSVLTGSGAGGGCGPYRCFRKPHLRKRVQKKILRLETDSERFLRLRGKLLDFDKQRALLLNDTVLAQQDLPGSSPPT